MIGWLKLSDEQRRNSLEQASARSGILAKAIEKDWWVTLSLKALFSTPFATYCMFKGGTSLSKGWKMIERLSEDIDIGLDPGAFGMKYEISPSKTYVRKLKKEGAEFTSTVLKAAIEEAFSKLGLAEGTITVTADPNPGKMPKDPQALYVHYRSLYDPHPYLPGNVKLEFSVKALREPSTTISIQSLLWEHFPNPVYAENPFDVTAAVPHKTIMEKTFLLHEKLNHTSPEFMQAERQSRHLYDIVHNMDKEAGTFTVNDHSLFESVLDHRQHYGLEGFDYSSLSSSQINFVPAVEWMEFFEKDYAGMKEMFYGQILPFTELIQRLKIFNGRMRLMGTGLLLEDVIRDVLESEDPAIANHDVRIVKLVKSYETENPPSKMVCLVTMHRIGGKLEFERIELTNKT